MIVAFLFTLMIRFVSLLLPFKIYANHLIAIALD